MKLNCFAFSEGTRISAYEMSVCHTCFLNVVFKNGSYIISCTVVVWINGMPGKYIYKKGCQK